MQTATNTKAKITPTTLNVPITDSVWIDRMLNPVSSLCELSIKGDAPLGGEADLLGHMAVNHYCDLTL